MDAFRQRDELLAADLPEAVRRRRTLALDVLSAGLQAVDPELGTERALVQLADEGVQLDGCTVLAFGKAASGMARAAARTVGLKQGLVVGFEEGEEGPLRFVRGRHPIPADNAPEHGQWMLQAARDLQQGQTALVLISGGGSALLELPVQGVSMADMQATTQLLLSCGADITEVNAVRRALSQLKGGRLAQAIAPARVVNIVLSDVIGSPLPAIASGPSVPPESPHTAAGVVERYGLGGRLPDSVRAALARPEPEAGGFGPITSIIAGDNTLAQEAMLDAALDCGLTAERLPHYLEGEAREAGRDLYLAARQKGTALIAGGETTVTLRGKGRGGRNQELVLGAVSSFEGGLLAALGTDGIDGQSDAAGALLDEVVKVRGGDPAPALAENDSTTYFEAAGGSLKTGLTGTNVADVALYLP